MIVINLEKAKIIAHNKRRAARATEFEPYDNAIAKQIPGEMNGAEAARQAIRDKYVILQTQIDAAITVEELKSLLP